MRKAKFVRVEDVPKREPVELPPQPMDPRRVITTKGLGENLDDATFVQRHAGPDDLKKVRREIEKKMEERPAFVFMKCDNPKCGFQVRSAHDTLERRPTLEERSCIRCNNRNFKGPGHLVPMSKPETKKFLEDEEARSKRVAAKMAIAERDALNRARAAEGRQPISEADFAEHKRREAAERAGVEANMRAAWAASKKGA